MYSKKDIDSRFDKLQSQINELANNKFQNYIQKKTIVIDKKDNNWIEILDTNDINHEYQIINIYINKHYSNISDHISSDKLRSNKIQLLYSHSIRTYFISIGDFRNDLPMIITIDYLQVPTKINIDI